MSRRRIRARRRRDGRSLVVLAYLGVIVLVTALLFSAAGVATAYGVAQSWLKELPDIEAPNAFRVAQPTKIYSADGKLLARLYLENRAVVPRSKMATTLVEAVIAVEDERFYQHTGIDLEGIARAAVTGLLTKTTRQGASTITQQYIRNTILSEELNEQSELERFRRKFREAYLARELEKRRTKDEILELYLNTVYFGEGAYGVEAAAQTYFSKRASQLTLAEASLLAGLPKAPSVLTPYDNPEGAVARRRAVLSRMVANGYITRKEADEAANAKLALKRAAEPTHGIYQAHYFVAHVKKLLQQQYSQAVVFQGGLSVYTTIDTKEQRYAERAVKSSLGRSGDPDGALVSIDPRSGHIKAMVGGEDYGRNKFNLATQGRRQPGSAFKTFVLVTALEDGMPPHRYVDSSSPARIPTKPKPWVVSNSEGSGRGYITMESATRSSVNTVFARLVWELGAKEVAKTAKRMGITSRLPAYPSIALGSQNVTPLEMASAYGTLAARGVHYPPVAITRVVDIDGKEIFKAEPKGRRALSPQIAYAATRILQGVITGGTARRAQIGRPAAGKTGTSQNHRDAWFVGYTPDRVCAVWVGYYKTERSMRSVHGVRGFGGTLAAPIWAKYMRAALKGRPALSFKRQANPKYTWKPRWSRQETPTPEPDAPKPKPKPKPTPAPTSTPPPTPPPTPDPTGTPKP